MNINKVVTEILQGRVYKPRLVVGCWAIYIVAFKKPLVVLVVALVERWTRGRKVTGSTRGRGAIKSTRSTQPSIPPG